VSPVCHIPPGKLLVCLYDLPMHSSRTIASRERLTAVVYDFGAAPPRALNQRGSTSCACGGASQRMVRAREPSVPHLRVRCIKTASPCGEACGTGVALPRLQHRNAKSRMAVFRAFWRLRGRDLWHVARNGCHTCNTRSARLYRKAAKPVWPPRTARMGVEVCGRPSAPRVAGYRAGRSLRMRL
jgi:hypothetical protein